MIDERFPNWDIDVENGTIYSLKHKRYICTIYKDGYVRVYPPKGYKHCKLHQYIWMCVNGDIPEGYDVHHIDGNKLNNSIYNLELIESTKHRSEHKKGNKYWEGKHHTEESKKKMSNAKIGKYHTEDTKNKISETLKGFKHSDETKRKISEANVNNPKLSKQVAQYTLDCKLVKVWNSSMECGRNGYTQSSVSSCCQGKRKTHKGFKWKYFNE